MYTDIQYYICNGQCLKHLFKMSFEMMMMIADGSACFLFTISALDFCLCFCFDLKPFLGKAFKQIHASHLPLSHFRFTHGRAIIDDVRYIMSAR